MPRGNPRTAVPGADLADEAVLLSALKDGDDDAFAYLVRTHGPRMLATARRLLRDPDAAQEALQDAFLSVHRSIGGFARRSSLATWLHRIVTNAALMKLRARGRLRECALDDALPRFDDLGFLIGSWTMTEESVDQLMDRSSVRKLVRDSIDELPDGYRTVLLLRDIEGFSTAEAASLLQISTGAVKVKLHRARLALKKRLAPALRGDER